MWGMGEGGVETGSAKCRIFRPGKNATDKIYITKFFPVVIYSPNSWRLCLLVKQLLIRVCRQRICVVPERRFYVFEIGRFTSSEGDLVRPVPYKYCQTSISNISLSIHRLSSLLHSSPSAKNSNSE